MDSITVCHQKRSTHACAQDLASEGGWLLWETCLRKIWLNFSPEIQPTLSPSSDVQVFRNEKAYHFLLEILCGLHSPIFGETEIFGQFKQFSQSPQVEGSSFASAFLRLYLKLMSDAKAIRKQHIVGFGSQSYGSMVRRLVAKNNEISIIGNGHLVEEILPWLIKANSKIRLYCRNPQKVDYCFQNSFDVFHLSEIESHDHQAIVVAAPIRAKDYNLKSSCQCVVDLRKNSQQDMFCWQHERYWTLEDFFQQFELQQSKKKKVKRQAEVAIEACVSRYRDRQVVRPYGWEDLCG